MNKIKLTKAMFLEDILFLKAVVTRRRMYGVMMITGLSKLIHLGTNSGIEILEELVMKYFIHYSKPLIRDLS